MRRLIWLALGFGAACGILEYCPWVWMALPAALLIAAFVLLKKRDLRKAAAWTLIGLLWGGAWSGGFRALYLTPAGNADGQTRQISVLLTDYCRSTSYGGAVEGRVELEGKPYRILLYLPQVDETMEPGDRITLRAQLRLTAEGGGREPTYHRTDGIFLLGYPRSEYRLEHGVERGLRFYPAKLRRMIQETVRSIFPEDTAPFVRALLLGDKSGMAYSLRNAFSLAGLSHVVAVSGMHISILFGVIYYLLGKNRWAICLVELPCLLLFAAVAGFTPSVCRASIMQALMLLAILVRREYDPPSALAFAALVLLLCNPLVIASVSFQLSVAAVAGIFLCSGPIFRRLAGEAKGKSLRAGLRRAAASAVAVSCGATVFTTPLVAWYFGVVSLLGVVVNVLCIWAVSAVFCGAGLACFAGILWPAGGKGIAWCISWLIRYVYMVVHGAAALPFCAIFTESIYTWVFLVGFYGLLLLFALGGGKHLRLFAGSAALLLVLCVGSSWAEPALDEMRITMLDVGQGQCILLQTRGSCFVVDCGGSYPEQAGELAARTLLSQGISRVDGVILTHYDQDHAGGLPQFLRRIGCDRVYLPDTGEDTPLREAVLEAAEGAALFVRQDMNLTFPGGKIQLFAPVFQEKGNESGISVLFTGANCDTLITGDLSIAGENRLLAAHPISHVDILVAGHHGSEDSTGYRLLRKLQPGMVLISVGKNTYGHPNDSTLERIASQGCKVLRTDEAGRIVIRK